MENARCYLGKSAICKRTFLLELAKKPEVAAKIDSDFESGIRSGANGTPSGFVNAGKFSGDPEDLRQLMSEIVK